MTLYHIQLCSRKADSMLQTHSPEEGTISFTCNGLWQSIILNQSSASLTFQLANVSVMKMSVCGTNHNRVSGLRYIQYGKCMSPPHADKNQPVFGCCLLTKAKFVLPQWLPKVWRITWRSTTPNCLTWRSGTPNFPWRSATLICLRQWRLLKISLTFRWY